jgi:hypothetical protein
MYGTVNIGYQFNLPVLATFDNLNTSVGPLTFADLYPELASRYESAVYDKMNWKEFFDKIDHVIAKLRESPEYVPIPPYSPPRYRFYYCESCDGSHDSENDEDDDNGDEVDNADDEVEDEEIEPQGIVERLVLSSTIIATNINGTVQCSAQPNLAQHTTPDPDPDFVNANFDIDEEEFNVNFRIQRHGDWNFDNMPPNPDMERMFRPYERTLQGDTKFMEKFNKANDFEKYRLVTEFICQETEKILPNYRFEKMVLRPEYRQRLSKMRAETLYPDLLIYAYAPPRLPYSWNEEAESLFYDDYIAECRKWRDLKIINPDRLPFDDIKYADDLESFVKTHSHTLVKITKNAAVALEDDLD